MPYTHVHKQTHAHTVNCYCPSQPHTSTQITWWPITQTHITYTALHAYANKYDTCLI